MGESELIKCAIGGDRRSFDQLCEPHRKDLYQFCFRFVRNVDDSNDLVQEILSRAWRHLGSFRLESSFRTWLWEIGRHLCLNHLRSRKNLIHRNTIHLEGPTPDEGGLESSVADKVPSPEAQALASADLEEIRKRIIELGRQRNWLQTDWGLFTLRIEDDVSYAEFAAKRGHDEAYWRNRWRDKIKPVFNQVQEERERRSKI